MSRYDLSLRPNNLSVEGNPVDYAVFEQELVHSGLSRPLVLCLSPFLMDLLERLLIWRCENVLLWHMKQVTIHINHHKEFFFPCNLCEYQTKVALAISET